ncbi:MAG: mismatch repair protein [Pseudomonadota bacterium]
MASLDTPMFRQYRELKAQAPDALLFFRMGDFYELFGDDAAWTADALELTLTARNKDDPDPIPMCGVPHHAAEEYVRRLLQLGRKVAIADQLEDPRQAKGIVKRGIVRILTPGLSGATVDAHECSWLGVVVGSSSGFGVAVLDATTGEVRAVTLRDAASVAAELARFELREAVVGPRAHQPAILRALGDVCTTVLPVEPDAAPVAALAGLGGLAAHAAGVALSYAEAHVRADLAALVHVQPWRAEQHLRMDDATRRNLELARPLRGTGRRGTLVGLLDVARTAMGGRLLRDWIAAPLLDRAAIEGRLDAVEALVHAAGLRRTLADALASVADIERILGRVGQGTATPRELAALRDSLVQAPALRGAIAEVAPLAARVPEDLVDDVRADLETWLVDTPPATLADGGVIRGGADPELDHVVALTTDARGAIARMEAALRAETQIASLKIRHSGQTGYYIELTRANAARAPASWIRRQTVANAERYVTTALKDLEEEVRTAEERRAALEAARFSALRGRVAAQTRRLQALARGLAGLDALAAFAECAVRGRWVRPELTEDATLALVGARHPVVEASLRDGDAFVPNDLRLDEQGRIVILTGPNMAGKSTLMRQVALVVLLAQAGCFVPASHARIGLCDRISVRVGASDDLAGGQSTFMVEMAETANILAQATSRSLVLLDEIGRGTSTWDGLAIAWAVAEDLHDRVRCRAVFATHYHELSALAETCAHLRNLHVAVAERGEDIVFLRTLREGAASGSYGIQCARLAGVPASVVGRARQLLGQLERRRPKEPTNQLSLFGGPPASSGTSPGAEGDTPSATPPPDALREALRALDVDALAPRQALEALYRLRDLAL